MINIKLILSKLIGNDNILSNNILFIDFMGSHEKGQFLSQIIYWSSRTNFDNGWFAKSYDEWFNEIRIKKDSLRRYTKELIEMGLIETKFHKFAGRPCKYYRLNYDNFIDQLVKFAEDGVADCHRGGLQDATVEGSKLPPSTVADCHRPYTEIKTEIKTDIKDNKGQKEIFLSDDVEIYSFDQFWNDFDKKVKKEKAKLAWKKLSKKNILEIKDHLPRYVESTPEKKYRVAPYRYLNEKYFRDEIIDYGKKGKNSPQRDFSEFASRASKYDEENT